MWGTTGDAQYGSMRDDGAQALKGWPAGLQATALACGHQHTLVVASPLDPPAAHANANLALRSTLKLSTTLELAPNSKPTASSNPVSEQSRPWRVEAVWSVETCADGAQRPPWVASCDVLAALSADGAAVDRAWLGRFTPSPAADVHAASPDVFAALEGADAVPGMRGACYRERGGGKQVCLPALSVLGVSKCGTTDLYHKLMQLK